MGCRLLFSAGFANTPAPPPPLPLPLSLPYRKKSIKDSIPTEVKKSYLAMVDPVIGGSNLRGDYGSHQGRRAGKQGQGQGQGSADADAGWENLEDVSSGPVGGGSSGVHNQQKKSGHSVHYPAYPRQEGVYGNASSSILSGISTKSASTEGSRFIRLGKNKPIKSAAIGQKFFKGHALNKIGNVLIKYNTHAHVRNAHLYEGYEEDEDSVGSNGSGSRASSTKYKGEIPYQRNKLGRFYGVDVNISLCFYLW